MTNPMGLTIPTAGVTPGPTYATEISDDLTTIASHTHTGASNNDGDQIPTAGLNINADLSMQSNNLVSARATRFTSQSLVLSGVGDINETYVVNGNLYYNNSSGTPIQLTAGGVINFTNTLNYSVLAVSTNHTINFADVVTVLECDTTSNTIIITLPAIVNVPAGRLYIVKDFKGTSETHAITINPAGANKIDQASNYIIADNHAAIGLVSDGVGNWSLYQWDRKVYGANDVIKLTNGASLTVDGYSSINTSGELIINGTLMLSNVQVNSLNTPYTVPGSSPNWGPCVILCNTSVAAITVNLPATSSASGMVLIIKDFGGNAATNNISVVPTGGDTIEALVATKKIVAPFGMLTLVNCYPLNNNWAMI